MKISTVLAVSEWADICRAHDQSRRTVWTGAQSADRMANNAATKRNSARPRTIARPNAQWMFVDDRFVTCQSGQDWASVKNALNPKTLEMIVRS